jgi:mono/diheme cytochrome c family protein
MSPENRLPEKKEKSMKFLLMLLTVGLSTAAFAASDCARAAEGAPQPADAAQADDSGMTAETNAKLVQMGNDLAQQHRCVVCHKEGGLAQPLATLAEGKADDFLKQAIANPKKTLGPATRMPAFDLTDEEIQALIAYLRSLPKPG